MASQFATLSLKIEPEYIQALDRVAEEQGITRSQLLRDICRNAASLYGTIKAERDRKITEKNELENSLSQWVVDNSPKDVSPELMHFLGQVMHRAAEAKASMEEDKKKS